MKWKQVTGTWDIITWMTLCIFMYRERWIPKEADVRREMFFSFPLLFPHPWDTFEKLYIWPDHPEPLSFSWHFAVLSSYLPYNKGWFIELNKQVLHLNTRYFHNWTSISICAHLRDWRWTLSKPLWSALLWSALPHTAEPVMESEKMCTCEDWNLLHKMSILSICTVWQTCASILK